MDKDFDHLLAAAMKSLASDMKKNIRLNIYQGLWNESQIFGQPFPADKNPFPKFRLFGRG